MYYRKMWLLTQWFRSYAERAKMADIIFNSPLFLEDNGQ